MSVLHSLLADAATLVDGKIDIRTFNTVALDSSALKGPPVA